MKWWGLAIFTMLVGLWLWRQSDSHFKPVSPTTTSKTTTDQKEQQQSERKPSSTPSLKDISPPAKDIASSPLASGAILSVEEFEEKYPGNWRFRKRTDESIQTISGGLILGAGLSEQSALAFARSISPILASGEFTLDSAPDLSAQSSQIETYLIQQKASGLDVYQGSMQIMARNSDGAVYIVNNRLRDITHFDSSPSLTILEGFRIVLERYKNAKITSPEEPQVFALKGQTSQLAWIYQVDISTPRPSHKDVVVSAVDGQILYEEERLIHD